MAATEKKIEELINSILTTRHIPTKQIIKSLNQYERSEIAARIDVVQYYKLGEYLLRRSNADAIELYLDIFRLPAFLTRIYDDQRWPSLILDLLAASNFTFPKLFRQRFEKNPHKPLFTTIRGASVKDHTWEQVAKRVDWYARGLLALAGDQNIAFFCKNSLDMACLDLACLTYGMINVMIPVNSVPSQIDYILQKTEPRVMIFDSITDSDQLFQQIKRPHHLKHLIFIFDSDQIKSPDHSLRSLGKSGEEIEEEQLEERIKSIGFTDLATLMFTSGTTGNPKGIKFSHQNIVFKRFARAMAIPEIGEHDIFLSYLPLYHTFGRWLEMTGCIFWNARYVFMENPSVNVMLRDMKHVRPTVFISIPKKWAQLYEHIAQQIDIIRSSDADIARVVQLVTGGRLKWGLSAAGHLDPDIFQFFQRYGIRLMSGFGMTEATGGITMTPPGSYRPNSLGKALPGIEIKLDTDGELLIRGPYVTPGYVNPDDSSVMFRDGWLATGDIMKMSGDGFIEIIDRKKEIYKNLRGETIAPQKIENLFRDFESVKHVFLVGDGRPYNTLLIYPDYDCEHVKFQTMSKEGVKEYFNSVVVSVNRFLAGFERIVDYVIIDRDFDPDQDELTPKGTYRRKVIEKNFATVIEPLYRQSVQRIATPFTSIIIPRWILRDLNIERDEIEYKNHQLRLKRSGRWITVRKVRAGIRVGNFIYSLSGESLNFEDLLSKPFNWLGNYQLVEFTGSAIYSLKQNISKDEGIYCTGIATMTEISIPGKNKITKLAYDFRSQLQQLHSAALILLNQVQESYKSALEFLNQAAVVQRPLVVEILKKCALINETGLQRSAFILLSNHAPDDEFPHILKLFLSKSKNLINKDFIIAASDFKLSEHKLRNFFELTKAFYTDNDNRTLRLFNFLAAFGSQHPTRFKIIRQFLVDCQLGGDAQAQYRQAARKAQLALRDGFRKWLGPIQRVAVDIESEEEYTWDDVITYEEDIPAAEKTLLSNAIKNSTLIREAVFLFSRGILVRLNDIPPGGVWISLLGREHGKAVFRVTVQTRFQGSFDIAVNLNKDLSMDEIIEETNWLIQAGTTISGRKLVEDYGGFWPKYGLWCEEFIAGETAGKFIRRMARRNNEADNSRLCHLWPFFIWSGATAYIHFWTLTGKRLELKEPTPDNVIVPVHDYQTGERIVTISARRKHKKLSELFLNLIRNYIHDTEEKYPILKDVGKPTYVFSAFIEALGTEEGINLLETCSEKLHDQSCQEIKNELLRYLDSVKKNGFLPKRLYFAIKRYQRWFELNSDATTPARAKMLSELYETYELHLIESEYPETRTRFFTNTVFRSAPRHVQNRLEYLIGQQRRYTLSTSELSQQISMMQQELEAESQEVFFLTRLSYPHIKPTDSVDFISMEAGGKRQTDIVIQREDYDGTNFWVRTPVNPKEIARLQNLFIANNLPVQFQSDHRFLIAVNDRGQLIGGLFYKIVDTENAHMEKIVVTNHYRKKGVSDGILTEFFDRMSDRHIRYITTGFFRPEYFYRFGFKTERKYAGLVKEL